MVEKGLSPLERFEQKTVKQTDFDSFLRYLTKEGILELLSAQDPNKSKVDRESGTRFLIGYSTARVLKNRTESGLPNGVFDLFTDPSIKYWNTEFVVDEEIKGLIGQGIAFGFEVAGLLPKNWQESLPGFNKPNDQL